MGHEGFYNSLLVAMGNVVSALLMYALQAAWLCQRLIDQDYRQNHGSRLTPILDGKDVSKPVEIVSTTPGFILPKNSHRLKPSRQGVKVRKGESGRVESSRFPRPSGDDRRRRYGHRSRVEGNATGGKLNFSHPYLENVTDALTMEYMNGLNQAFGLRRAFSDINISSTWSNFSTNFCDNNQNCMPNENFDETTYSVTDEDFVKMIFTKGYVT